LPYKVPALQSYDLITAMKLKVLSALVLLSTSTIAFAAFNGGPALLDDPSGFPFTLSHNTPGKNPFVNEPGANAFEGNPPGSNSGSNAVTNLAVPEPSTIGLICLGALGFGLLKFRRRS
jgi:PEP-CTERM motif